MEPISNGNSFQFGGEAVSVSHGLVMEGATREGNQLMYGWSRIQRVCNPV